MVTSLPMEGHCIGLWDFTKDTRFVVGDEARIRFWEDLWAGGDQPLGSQFSGLFRIVTIKKLPISSILGSFLSFLLEL